MAITRFKLNLCKRFVSYKSSEQTKYQCSYFSVYLFVCFSLCYILFVCFCACFEYRLRRHQIPPMIVIMKIRSRREKKRKLNTRFAFVWLCSDDFYWATAACQYSVFHIVLRYDRWLISEQRIHNPAHANFQSEISTLFSSNTTKKLIFCDRKFELRFFFCTNEINGFLFFFASQTRTHQNNEAKNK